MIHNLPFGINFPKREVGRASYTFRESANMLEVMETFVSLERHNATARKIAHARFRAWSSPNENINIQICSKIITP
jgi:hypothetical protein